MRKIAVSLVCLTMSFAAIAGEPSVYDASTGYVTITGSDTNSSRSWNVKGKWSDGQIPHPDTNYYVGASYALYRPHVDGGDVWKGGRLVIAGTFHDNISGGIQNAGVVSNLVLLGGSLLRFPGIGGIKGNVTVVSDPEHPAKAIYTIADPGSARTIYLESCFHGDVNAAMEFERPFTYGETSIGYGGYFLPRPWTFTNYFGQVIVTGGNTLWRPGSGQALSIAGTLVARDGGKAMLHYDTKNLTGNEVSNIGSVWIDGGVVESFYSGGVNYPCLNLTGPFVATAEDSRSRYVVLGYPLTDIIGKTEENPTPTRIKVAHLTDSGFASTRLDPRVIEVGEPVVGNFGWGFLAEDSEAGGKDLFLTCTNLITMTVANTDTSGSSAFQSGNDSYWSTGRIPTGDFAGDLLCLKKFSMFANIDMPKAAITLTGSCTWKGGSDIVFREFNMAPGATIGVWSGGARKIRGGAFKTFRSSAESSASLYMFQNKSLVVESEVRGEGPLLLRNYSSSSHENSRATISLSNVNTNFGGRLTLQNIRYATVEKVVQPGLSNFLFKTYLGDARSWGGPFTGSEKDPHASIRFVDYPRVFVTNSVAFAEPTRTMLVQGGVGFDVSAGKTLTLSNQVTWAGEFFKMGAGTLELGGSARFVDGLEETAPLEGTNVLTVAAGALKVSSRTAADGLAITFAENTKLIVPAHTEFGLYDVKWDVPITVDSGDGKLNVQIEGLDAAKVGTGVSVPLLTLSKTAADNFSSANLVVDKPGKGLRVTRVVAQENTTEDGTVAVTYSATVETAGMTIILR